MDSTDKLGNPGSAKWQYFTRRTCALFEVADALLCTPIPVHNLAHLSLDPAHRTGTKLRYGDDAMNAGGAALGLQDELAARYPIEKVPGPDEQARLIPHQCAPYSHKHSEEDGSPEERRVLSGHNDIPVRCGIWRGEQRDTHADRSRKNWTFIFPISLLQRLSVVHRSESFRGYDEN